MSTPTILNKFLPPWWENSTCESLYVPKKKVENVSFLENRRTFMDCLQDIYKLHLDYTKKCGVPSYSLIQDNPFKMFDIPNIEDCIYDSEDYVVDEETDNDNLDMDYDDEYVTDDCGSDSEDDGEWVDI